MGGFHRLQADPWCMTTPRISRSVLAAGAAAMGALGAIGVAQLAGSANPVMQFTQAQSTDDATTTTAPATGGAPAENKEGCGDKTPLDEATAAKVKAAALEAVPGATLLKAHADRDGDGYAALLTKADGTTKALVHMDSAFKVTSVEDPAPIRMGRHGGHGGRGHGPGPAEAPAAEGQSSSVNL